MKKFETVRKPIYIAEITASAKDFAVTSDIFKHFIAKNPQYADCKYDRSYSDDTWTLRLFRECAIDFVE
jgi:hypothetical protein